MPLNRKMLGLFNDEMTLITKLKEIACPQLEMTAVSHKCIIAWLPLISWDDVTPRGPGQRNPLSLLLLPRHLLSRSESGPQKKASQEPDSDDGVCSPAALACLPWWE